MSAIADLGAMLKMPDVPTTQEWNTAKNNYQSISDQIDKRIPGIWQEVQAYNDIKYSGQTGADTQASQFLSLHPEISQAQALREQAILADPVLSKYYGGIKTLTLYWTNSDHNFLLAKYGKDIYQKEYAYYNENLTPASRRLYIAQHPELKGFFKDNRTLSDQVQLAINSFPNTCPNLQRTILVQILLLRTNSSRTKPLPCRVYRLPPSSNSPLECQPAYKSTHGVCTGRQTRANPHGDDGIELHRLAERLLQWRSDAQCRRSVV